ncbi:septum formation protein Maf [Leptospira langatensis]|uniref:dTTP/UTP pyrophosphatase n=1 Tax=Leptospira langatensis TaxID=2484983 RepID=A0A5F1ZWD0_9LEPT|nr:nucleoside triphosphate pyrophosphatase [Leptospira langatensis]TGK03140.1 septum formation protein Maf [Leptospira langatensis]TGL41897.1 septum formation protein Maf [Leptospira langatensis]
MLILRSQSPRRKEILQSLGLEFQVLPLPINEANLDQEKPLEYLKRVTVAKLGPSSADTEQVIVSSDTIVVYQDRILQKPADDVEAFQMLSMLSGKSHRVYSGIGIRTANSEIFDYDSSDVEFHDWKEDQIKAYILEAKPFDKAGAYGIQDRNSPAKSYQGSYTNILGFPIRKFFLYHSLWSKFL